jgi:AraC-like DNA-binding protein
MPYFKPSERVRNMTLGFFGSLEPTTPMGYFQRHNEIEINFARSDFEYTINGKSVHIPVGRLVIFWAINAHEITWIKSPNGQLFHITIPLPWFLNWQLPAEFVRQILGGEILIETNQTSTTNDEILIKSWCQELSTDDTLLHNVVLLELQARLTRFAINFSNRTSHTNNLTPKTYSDSQMEKVAIMAKFVAEHGHENIYVSDIAKVAKLHPNYATNLFKEICGVSLVKFLITHRITLAQILLVSTSKKIITIAFESGFNSLSQFYTHFQNLNGITPYEYRHNLNHKKSHISN